MAAKYTTGYATFDQAVKDKFAKIGGLEEVMGILETGWYQKCQRKEQNIKMGKLRELAKNDPAYKGILERAKQQLGR